MHQGPQSGMDILSNSIAALFKFKILLIPLLVVWVIYASAIIYFKWYFDWDIYDSEESLCIFFLITFGFALLLTLSCSILLELIQQKETGKPFNLLKSLGETLTKNIAQIIVLSFIWAVFWFFLTILDTLISMLKKSKKQSSEEEDDHSLKGAAEALSGKKDHSLFSLSISALNKGIRMIVFLIMPAFAWEDMSINQSFKRGFSILRKRIPLFVSGYNASFYISFIIFFPSTLMFYIDERTDFNFPDWSWGLCIIYMACAWSFSIYLEQMLAAGIYLWQVKWEKEVEKAEKKGKKPPTFYEVKLPEVIDKRNDLAE